MEEKTNKTKLEEINKSFKENQGEKTIKQLKQTVQTAQELNTENDAIRKTQLREFWIWKIGVNKLEPQRQV